ncbi:MAG: hypothetical protein KDE27_01060 [Planctomycetes bacterium]|nr:hypothetical protein [Planctomycetota bacterium]
MSPTLALLALSAAPPLAAQCSTAWVADPEVPGADNIVFAVREWLPTSEYYVVGGDFTMGGPTQVNRVALVDLSGATPVWMPLGSGADARVLAVATTSAADIVAVGQFTQIGGVPAQHMARFDFASQTWMPISSATGPITSVNAVAVAPNDDIVIGGDFNYQGGFPANRIGRWDGVAWTDLGGPLVNGRVYAVLILPNGDLVAGGTFSLIGTATANFVAQFNGSSWSAMGAGTSGTVNGLALDTNGDVLAATRNGIERWNGTAWSAVGSPGVSGGARGAFSVAVMTNGDLIAGGDFTTVAGISANHVARWNGSSWSALGSGTDTGPQYAVTTLAASSTGGVIAGGDFSVAGGTGASRLARWNGSSWQPIGSGLAGYVWDMVGLPNGDIVAGGDFLGAGGLGGDRIASFDGTAWSSLGTGLDGRVWSVVRMPNGDIVAGGEFTVAGGVAANRVARWDGTAWNPLGSGLDGTVSAMTVSISGDLIVGGGFSTAGGVAASRIARWDGTSWFDMNGGVTSTFGWVESVSDWGGAIIAGGNFTSMGGTAVTNIAWFDGLNWQAMGTLPYSYVLGVLSTGFPFAASANAVWTFDGAAWNLVGGAFDGGVYGVVELPNGDLLASGSFTANGGVAMPGIARWDGSQWDAVVGAALPGASFAMAKLPDGDVAVGGAIGKAGVLVRLTTTCPATAPSFGSGCNSSAGPVVLEATDLPFIDSTFRARTSGMPALSLAVAVRGLSQVATPLSSILPQGVPGCLLLASADLTDLFVPAGGIVDTSFPIPLDPNLVGQMLKYQVLSLELDPGNNITAVTSSNGLDLTIGAF